MRYCPRTLQDFVQSHSPFSPAKGELEEFGQRDIAGIRLQHDKISDTSALESKIDSLVYQLYNLTDEEIKIVESK